MKNLMEFSFAIFSVFLILLQEKNFLSLFFGCYELHFLQKILLLVSVYMYKKNELKMTQILELIYKKELKIK
jgi:hypothetical protein